MRARSNQSALAGLSASLRPSTLSRAIADAAPQRLCYHRQPRARRRPVVVCPDCSTLDCPIQHTGLRKCSHCGKEFIPSLA